MAEIHEDKIASSRKKVYIEGFNTEGENFLHSTMVPDGARDEKELHLRHISTLFKEIKAKADRGGYEVNGLEVDENGEVRSKYGLAMHFIPSKSHICDRLDSIAENGLLACEWFGLYYEENEVPYQVSFHALRDGKLGDQICNLNNKVGRLKDCDALSSLGLIVDFESPIMQEILGIKNYLEQQGTRPFMLQGGKVFHSADEENLSFINEYVKDKMRAYDYKLQELNNHAWRKKILITPFTRFEKSSETEDEPVMFDVDKEGKVPVYYVKREIYEQQVRKEATKIANERLRGATVSCFAGVPSQAIVGIFVPKNVEITEELCRLINEKFPNAIIIDSNWKKVDVSLIVSAGL